jgi:hypothetical protein
LVVFEVEGGGLGWRVGVGLNFRRMKLDEVYIFEFGGGGGWILGGGAGLKRLRVVAGWN